MSKLGLFMKQVNKPNGVEKKRKKSKNITKLTIGKGESCRQTQKELGRWKVLTPFPTPY